MTANQEGIRISEKPAQNRTDVTLLIKFSTNVMKDVNENKYIYF